LALAGLGWVSSNLWSVNIKKHPEVSIIIPTYGRPKSLKRCLDSIKDQTFKDYEIIKVTEKGPLARIRNMGASRANGWIMVFIDDDTFCDPRWLESIVWTFRSKPHVGGVSGPAITLPEYRAKRDIFRYSRLKRIYDFLFLEGQQHIPGHITKAGTWTTGACDEDCDYDGPVEYLEACNMAFRSSIFKKLGGFDETYKGVGDWSEPDLAFRVRETGSGLWFNRNASLYHEPSTSGAFKKRKADAWNRYKNYLIFSKRWVKPHWRHTLFKMFMWTYYAIATIK